MQRFRTPVARSATPHREGPSILAHRRPSPVARPCASRASSRLVSHPRAQDGAVSHHTHPRPPAKTRRGRDQSKPVGRREGQVARRGTERASQDLRSRPPAPPHPPKAGTRERRQPLFCTPSRRRPDTIAPAPPPLPLTEKHSMSFGTSLNSHHIPPSPVLANRQSVPQAARAPAAAAVPVPTTAANARSPEGRRRAYGRKGSGCPRDLSRRPRRARCARRGRGGRARVERRSPCCLRPRLSFVLWRAVEPGFEAGHELVRPRRPPRVSED